MPFRVLGTTVLGRAVGRIVPYVGWVLIAIDIVEIIVECTEYRNNGNDSERKFNGGNFGGAGASGYW